MYPRVEHRTRGSTLHMDCRYPTIPFYRNIYSSTCLIFYQSTLLRYLNPNCKTIHTLWRLYNRKWQQHNAKNKKCVYTSIEEIKHYIRGSTSRVDHIQPFHSIAISIYGHASYSPIVSKLLFDSKNSRTRLHFDSKNSPTQLHFRGCSP